MTKKLGTLTAITLLLVIAVAASLDFGARSIPFSQIIAYMDGTLPADDIVHAVITSRIHRTLAAIIAGAALAASGTAMQAITRNPLADPGIIGINSGAALAVVTAMTFGGNITGPGLLPYAFLGAGAAALLVFATTSLRGSGNNPLTIILAGAAVAAGCGSITTGLIIRNAVGMDEYRRWMLGSVSGRSTSEIIAAAIAIGCGIVLLYTLTKGLNALELGDEVAQAIGINRARTRSLTILAITLCCGASTALVGPIGFIGIMMPYVLRRIGFTGNGWNISGGILGGALLIVTADTLGRIIQPPAEIPAGALIAIIGAPVMIHLARKVR